MARFVKRLNQTTNVDEVDKSFAIAIFYVEKELGAYITETYPLMKFFSQLEELQRHNKKEREESEKMRTR